MTSNETDPKIPALESSSSQLYDDEFDHPPENEHLEVHRQQGESASPQAVCNSSI